MNPTVQPAATAILSARALAIGYPTRELASGIDFTLEAGSAMAILGPNGSGKTTLFRTLLGLLPARGGDVHLGTQSIAAMTPTEVARAIAYVPQATAGFFNFSVIEVVEMARAAHLDWYAQPGARDREIAMQALADLNISHFATREFAELSGGERQLVLIARALASEARILLLDEPTASLDFGNQFLILDRIAGLKSRGVSIVFTTHQPDHALRVCTGAADRTLTIARDGRIALGPTSELLTAESLTSLYGLPVAVVAGPDGPLLHVRSQTQATSAKALFSRAVPFLACHDVASTLDFYVDRLGFAIDWTWPDQDDVLSDAGVVRDGISLYFMRNAELAARVHDSELMLEVSPIESIHAEHRARAAPISTPLRDEPWGVREYSVTDPNGYRLRFCESLADIAARDGPSTIEEKD